jgi:hypothetical protein
MAQGIFKAVPCSIRLACTPSRLGLYSKSSKGGTLYLKVPPLPWYNFLKAFRT